MESIIKIEITERFLETYGTGTLIGTILQANDCKWPDKVRLVFPQTSMSWRRKNNGPKHYVMPEFAPWLFVEDVLDLIERKIEVELIPTEYE